MPSMYIGTSSCKVRIVHATRNETKEKTPESASGDRQLIDYRPEKPSDIVSEVPMISSCREVKCNFKQDKRNSLCYYMQQPLYKHLDC